MKKIASIYRYRLDKEKEDGTFCGCEFFDTLEEAEFFGKIHQDFVEKTFNLISFNTKKLFTVWEVKVKPNHKKERGYQNE